jgi:hypothetical protein
MTDPRNVILDIEKEYTQKIRAKYNQDIPPFKAGDKIRITKYISLQKEKFEEICVCLSHSLSLSGSDLFVPHSTAIAPSIE